MVAILRASCVMALSGCRRYCNLLDWYSCIKSWSSCRMWVMTVYTRWFFVCCSCCCDVPCCVCFCGVLLELCDVVVVGVVRMIGGFSNVPLGRYMGLNVSSPCM